MKRDFWAEEKGGLTRYYLKPFPLEAEIPDVTLLIKQPQKHLSFMKHVFYNHKGLNWKIFRYGLNQSNYKSFLYAFAYRMPHFPPTHSAGWQIEANARRLKKALKRVGICLSDYENEILDICLNFRKWNLNEVDRMQTALMLQLNIAGEYGLISEHPSNIDENTAI